MLGGEWCECGGVVGVSGGSGWRVWGEWLVCVCGVCVGGEGVDGAAKEPHKT